MATAKRRADKDQGSRYRVRLPVLGTGAATVNGADHAVARFGHSYDDPLQQGIQ